MSNSNQILRSSSRSGQCLTGTGQREILRPRFLIGLLVCACGFMLPACRSAPPASNTASTQTRTAAFTTPPFPTKEPGRYQATRITTVTETGGSEASSISQRNQVLIARDGEKRREEYSAGASGQIVHLEIPTGRFLLLPASRMYADLGTFHDADPGKSLLDSADESPELSPDQLLNEAHAPATYEILGTETLAGRPTTKYRVVVANGTESQSEALIWIDEALGMPVRSETTSKSGGHSSTVTMELKDVKLELDESLFSWPSDYRKVDARTILDLTRQDAKASAPKQE